MDRRFSLAAGEGFEPSHTESESAVLPLHNPAKRICYYSLIFRFVKSFLSNFPKFFGALLGVRKGLDDLSGRIPFSAHVVPRLWLGTGHRRIEGRECELRQYE